MGQLRKGGAILIRSVEVAHRLPARLVGLLGRPNLEPGRALWLNPCGGVHTFFMRFHLDLVFLDRHMTVLKVVRNVAPARLVFGGRRAKSVVEMQTGWLSDAAVEPGDCLDFIP